MGALRRKLNEQQGASLLMALLMLLVALMVSAVVLAGASGAVSSLRTGQRQQQASLTVTSAAELIRNSFLSGDMKYVSTTVSYEYYYNHSWDYSRTATQAVPDEAAFSAFANYAIGQLRSGQPVLPQVYTLHAEDTRLSDVQATFYMAYDVLNSGESSYILTVELENLDEDAPYRMSLRMPSVIKSDSVTNEQSYYYKQTTVTETIQWTDGGTIQRKEAGA